MKVIIAGDLCPTKNIIDSYKNSKNKSDFESIKRIISNAEYSLVNLEAPICTRMHKPILKLGPNLCVSEETCSIISGLGFKGVTLANNHIMDYGIDGLNDTINCCNAYNIDYVGAGLDSKSISQVLYRSINNKILAIINCCEQEFSIAFDDTAGANHMDVLKIHHDIVEAKKNSDYIIVVVHGGHEHWQHPSPRMVETYRFFIESGADAVINHHQHCYCGMELYKNKPIFYGIGNFFFESVSSIPRPNWKYGFIVELELLDNINYKIYPYIQCADTPTIKLLPIDYFKEKLCELNAVITDREKLMSITRQYYNDCMKESALAFEPVQNRLVQALQIRSLLPLFRSRKGLLLLYNYILCESHRDKIKHYLMNKIHYE